MINLSGMNEGLAFAIGFVIFLGMMYLIREENAAKVRKSNWWPIAFLGWPLALSIPFKLMAPVLDKMFSHVEAATGTNDDAIIPFLFGAIILVCVAMVFYQTRKMKRSLRG
jgi:hypothetical protein